MQEFKIHNYERDNGKGTFTPFRHLSCEEGAILRTALGRRLKLPENALGCDILRCIHGAAVSVGGANAKDDRFDLLHLVSRLGYVLPAVVYLNWYQFDDIDELRAMDLAHRFSDIWYPETDDIEIVDIEMRWIVAVTHGGSVKLLDLGV